MPKKTFQEKYAEARQNAHHRLVEDNFLNNSNNYFDYNDKRALFIDRGFFISSLQYELMDFVAIYGITQEEIKENFYTIAKDTLETLEQNPTFLQLKNDAGYEDIGLIDNENNYALTNEDITNPENMESALEIFGVESDRKFFNLVYSPDAGASTLNKNYLALEADPSIDQIKKGLFSLANVKKIHDARPFFGRPDGYSKESDEIEDFTKKIRAYGFTDKDMSKIFKSSEKDLENTINSVCKTRLENEKTRIDQEDYSKGNVDFISPHNLHLVFAQEKGAVEDRSKAKHAVRLLNSYITAKRKYEKAGFFTKYFNKDYRDLKKSINSVEKFLTSNKTENGSPKKQMFTEKQLNELLKRDEPLTVERDLQFLKSHNIRTFEQVDAPEQQQNTVIKENNDLSMQAKQTDEKELFDIEFETEFIQKTEFVNNGDSKEAPSQEYEKVQQ